MAVSTSCVYRFGEFCLDPAARELWRGGEEQALPPKAFACLLYLVEHRDRAIGRDELIDAVWSREHLADSVLGHAIFTVRRALDDNGEEPRCIKTVRSFGYRWIAPVEVEKPAEMDVATASSYRSRRYWTVAVLAAVGLVLALGYAWHRRSTDSVETVAGQLEAGDIAMLLPAIIEAGDQYRWLRFGVMDLITERLRTAGQTMVPSETVIALMRDLPAEPAVEARSRLTSATGARLVLGVRVESTDAGWRVSVRNLDEEAPSLSALGEAADVLEAARTAADRMALYLGFTPPPEPDTCDDAREGFSPGGAGIACAEPGLELLLQQIEAARLAQQMEVARELIESADPALRRHPRIRHQWAGLAFYSYQLDVAEAEVRTLLEEVPAAGDPVFRARLLNSLAAVQLERGDNHSAVPFLEEALHLLSGRDAPEIAGAVREQLGIVAAKRDDFPGAREHFAHARRIHESTGNTLRLASLDLNIGATEMQRERPAQAMHYYRKAAERRFELQDLGGELLALAYLMRVHLVLLDPPAALELEPRVDELLARTANPQLTAIANLSRVSLFDAVGRREAAGMLLDEVLAHTSEGEALRLYRLQARLQAAENALHEGNADTAMQWAGEVVDQWRANHDDRTGDATYGQAWLALFRTRVEAGDLEAAAETAAAMSDWARHSQARSARMRAELAAAELAAAQERHGPAGQAFERALVLADTSQVPAWLLEVAQSYAAWLLDEAGGADPEKALQVADYLSEYVHRDFEAALLQLRAYHALGPASAWRAALERAAALAGERTILPELRDPPRNK